LVDTKKCNWRYVGFEAHQLKAGESITIETATTKYVALILSGKANAKHQALKRGRYWRSHERVDQKAPYSVYSPAQDEIRIERLRVEGGFLQSAVVKAVLKRTDFAWSSAI